LQFQLSGLQTPLASQKLFANGVGGGDCGDAASLTTLASEVEFGEFGGELILAGKQLSALGRKLQDRLLQAAPLRLALGGAEPRLFQ
jgi:hypothetical protein